MGRALLFNLCDTSAKHRGSGQRIGTGLRQLCADISKRSAIQRTSLCMFALCSPREERALQHTPLYDCDSTWRTIE
jgi:hypothetical protein